MSDQTTPAAPLSDEVFDELAFMDFAGLMSADAAAVVGRMRNQLVDEIRRMQGYVARVEAVLCECEPERDPRDYRQPGTYMHAAGCLVADLQQVEAVAR